MAPRRPSALLTIPPNKPITTIQRVSQPYKKGVFAGSTTLIGMGQRCTFSDCESHRPLHKLGPTVCRSDAPGPMICGSTTVGQTICRSDLGPMIRGSGTVGELANDLRLLYNRPKDYITVRMHRCMNR